MSEHKQENNLAKELLLINKLNLYRGIIITHATIIERYLDIFLAKYFCADISKRAEFTNVVLGNNRISFDTKRKIFETVIKNVNHGFKKEFPSFGADMNIVINQRNIFAHCTPDFTPEAKGKKGVVGLIKYGVNKRTEWYDDAIMDGVLQSFRNCQQILRTTAEL